jgi:hypothetical protein
MQNAICRLKETKRGPRHCGNGEEAGPHSPQMHQESVRAKTEIQKGKKLPIVPKYEDEPEDDTPELFGEVEKVFNEE